MICMHGDSDEMACLPRIAELGAGVELESYGLVGVRSEEDWEARFTAHKAVRGRFSGLVAIHGPFIGMEYAHVDHLIREAVRCRMDMIFDVATQLGASRVILHGGYAAEVDIWGLQDTWLNGSLGFWQREIRRWADANIVVVLENDVQRSPDLLVRLVREVDHPFLGLCFDIGHQHLLSNLDATEWVRRMGGRLWHVHLHDNDRTADCHWPIGRGTIDFGSFFDALAAHAPEATISLEVDDSMQVRMRDLRSLATRFTPRPL
jgi:sugar phosphate isomerase/epimerase